ncbi:uncharacterized protein LOC113206290 [Frankliniella occidentalis]|uniref:Uncharacterized protein LOC113206290 n=1 Tax=Frankliniella occidentalis TaxID=133901 RepID=A0A6J1SAJ5_FRAOC|nr:uncharacterized protein LOC113206290 [Frankliniella occidentalis]
MTLHCLKPCPPERILVCIDAVEDKPIRSLNHHVKQLSTFDTVKNCAELFITTKSLMNPEHQFAVCQFKAQLILITGFHSRVGDHLKVIHGAIPNQATDNPYPYRLSALLKTIHEKAVKEEDNERPLHVVIFYGRSGSCILDENVLSPYKNVVIDILYLHKPLLSAKEKKRIIANLVELKKCLSEKSVCSVALNDNLLAYKYTMNFLMHPNQRVPILKEEDLSQVYQSDSD